MDQVRHGGTSDRTFLPFQAEDIDNQMLPEFRQRNQFLTFPVKYRSSQKDQVREKTDTPPADNATTSQTPTPADLQQRPPVATVPTPDDPFGEYSPDPANRSTPAARQPAAVPPANAGQSTPPQTPSQVPPRVPNDEGIIPDPRRDQQLPSFNDPLPRATRDTREDAPSNRLLERAERERLERERNQREKSARKRDRSRDDAADPDRKQAQWPRKPGSDPNGPDSWYRPGQQTPLQRQPNAMETVLDPNSYNNGYGQPTPAIPQYGPPATGSEYYRENYPLTQAPQYHAPQQPSYQQHQSVVPNAGDGLYQGVMSGSTLVQSNGNSYAEAGCQATSVCDSRLSSGVCCDPTFYLSVFGGYSDLDSLLIDASDNSTSVLDISEGYGLGGAIGQYQGRNLRTEIEFSYRRHSADQLELIGNADLIGPQSVDGEVQTFAGMANMLWEFAGVGTSRLKPYVGGGIGFASVETSLNLNEMDIVSPTGDSDSSFAYQFMGGINYRAAADIDLFAEYRLFKADSLRLETMGVHDSLPNGTGGFDYHADNFFAGIRYKF